MGSIMGVRFHFHVQKGRANVVYQPRELGDQVCGYVCSWVLAFHLGFHYGRPDIAYSHPICESPEERIHD